MKSSFGNERVMSEEFEDERIISDEGFWLFYEVPKSRLVIWEKKVSTFESNGKFYECYLYVWLNDDFWEINTDKLIKYVRELVGEIGKKNCFASFFKIDWDKKIEFLEAA